MAVCEKCWGDANTRFQSDESKSVYAHYIDLLAERKNNPCNNQTKPVTDIVESRDDKARKA